MEYGKSFGRAFVSGAQALIGIHSRTSMAEDVNSPAAGSSQTEASGLQYPQDPKVADPCTTPYHANSISSKHRLEIDRYKGHNEELLREISDLKGDLAKREGENRELAGENRKKGEENRKLAVENRKKEEETRKMEQNYYKAEAGWKVRYQGLERENKRLQVVCAQHEQQLKKQSGTISKYSSDIQRLSRLEQSLKNQLGLEQKKYTEYHAAVSTEKQQLQQQNQDFQDHIGSMSQIISQLNKGGLPEAHDDRYYMDKLDDLVETISEWARLFSRGQPPLTMEELKNTRVTSRVREHLISAFIDIRSLLGVKNVGGKVRTRFVEAIMLRTLMGDRLWERHIGFPEDDYKSHSNLIQKMSSSEEEARAWSALTIHRLTKDNQNLHLEKEKEIDAMTDMVLVDLSSFSGSTRATREKLRDIISKVAELGLELARLPFEIRPITDLNPGNPFVEDMMIDMDPEDEDISEMTTIILSYPWVKVTYDETGKGVVYQNTYLCKARVSCIR